MPKSNPLISVAACLVFLLVAGCSTPTTAQNAKRGTVDDVWTPSGHTGWPKGGISNLIDGKGSTKWCTPTNKKWPVVAQFELPRGKACVLSQYTFTAADDIPERDPKTWVVLGSNDGKKWSVIDQRQGRSIMKRQSKRIFAVKSDKAFTRFRIEFKANHGADGFQLSEIFLSGTFKDIPAGKRLDRFADALPSPTPKQVETTKPLKAVPTTLWNKDGVWCFRGIIGPLGVMAQRTKQKVGFPARFRRREYRVLSVDRGSPSHGKLLPGDIIIGLNGDLFKPGKYVNKAAENFKSYREPNWEMGMALHKAFSKDAGKITLTVQRGEQKGTVALQLPKKKALSATYPWDCQRSQELCREIADNFLNEMHGKRQLEPWRAAWYGLFLLNYNSTKYRSTIDDIAKAVRQRLDTRSVGNQVRGVRNGNSTWQMAFEAIFLAEYAIMTRKQRELHTDLNRYVQLLFASRMIGNLWGHADSVNYGSMHGGFIGASCHATLALLVMKAAGAHVTPVELQKVLDTLSGSIQKNSGQITYQCKGDTRALLPFDWKAIDKNISQVHSESIMRQGGVHLAMRFAGRMTEAEATFRFLCRQTAVFATHGMIQDTGVFEGARALASSSPRDCRALLDSYLPRLYMSMRWDGGVHLIPAGRDPSGKDEYSAYRERGIEQYVPGVIGLLLSMPQKKLHLYKNVLSPKDKAFNWPARKPRTKLNESSVRSLTYADGSAYFVGPDEATPTKWSVYQQRFKGNKKTAIVSGLDEAPYELLSWKGKLIISGTGRKGGVWAWDPKGAGKPVVLNSYDHSRASQFTEFQDSLYYISPQENVGRGNPYVGGVLWRTRDGVKAERATIVRGGGPLWGLLHGCSAWQTIRANARSLQAIELGAGPRLFCQTQQCSGGNANLTRPAPRTQNIWMTDGNPVGAHHFLLRPLADERWPGHMEVLAIDNNNSRIGTLIGLGYGGRLFFQSAGKLQVSDRRGATSGLFKLGQRTFSRPNNFATLKLDGKEVFAFSFQAAPGKRRLAITDGAKLIAEIQAGKDKEFSEIRKLTSVGDSLYFVGFTEEHGAELWHTKGSTKATKLVRDFHLGPGNSLVDNLVALNGRIYFTAWDTRYGTELWRHDPKKGSLAVADIVPGRSSSRPQQVRRHGKWLVFCMDTPVNSSAVMRYADGEKSKRVVFKVVR